MKNKVKFKKFFIVVFVIFLVFIVSLLISSKESSSELFKGKNYITLNVSEPFYVETIVKLNPLIEAVSYEEENETIGYVNVFGGIGKNFVVINGEYEIIVKENTNLVLP